MKDTQKQRNDGPFNGEKRERHDRASTVTFSPIE